MPSLRRHRHRHALPVQLMLLLQVALLSLLSASVVTAADTNNNNNNNSSSKSNSTDVSTASDTIESIFDSAKGIKVGGSILAVLAIAAGAVVCLAGYKLFRSALFVVGFVAGGVLVAIAVEHIFKSESWVVTASWIAFVVGGVFAGCLVVSLYTTSIFVAGAAGGVLLAMLVNTSFGYKIYPSDPNVSLIILAVIFGIVCGVLALKLEKPVLVVATAFVGAGLLVWGVGYFAGDFPSMSDLKRFATQDANGDWVYAIPSAWWAYLAGILVLFVLGAAVQFHKTGRGGEYHRSHALPSRQQSQNQTQYYGNAQTPQEQQQQQSNVRYGNPVSHV